MLETNLQDEELSLRKEAAKGNYKKVKEILERNKGVDSFDVNGGSSNGNAALHWACAKVMETKQGLSERYAKTTSESLCSRKILAVVPPKFVRITRLKVGPDSSCVRHALAHSGLRAVAPTMTLRRDAFPASPVNARLSRAP
jgi:hypothetical protein